MDGAWLAAGHFAAAALMLLLAGVMLWIDASSRAVRAFVFLLILRAGVLVALAIAVFADPTTEAALASTMAYYDIALTGAIAYFLTLYPRRRGGIWRALVLAGTVTLLAVWTFAPCLMVCGDLAEPGPLVILYNPSTLFSGLAAGLIAFSTRAMPEGSWRTSSRVVAAALAFEASLYAGISIGFGSTPNLVWIVTSWLVALTALGFVLRGRSRWIVLGSLISVSLAGVAVLKLLGNERVLVLGALRTAVPLLIAYALARHRLLGLDIKVKLAARRATIGAVFAGVFFVVTEGGAYALGSQFGMVAGIVAVGALVPLMGPLRRAAERVTQFLPGEEGAPRELPLERRRQIYHDFALQAWADGVLARQERAFLDQLRERLALPAEDAMRLESEASQLYLARNG